MIDRMRYFPTKTFMFIILAISVVINIHLYNELKSEQGKRYWISTSEYKQIVNEIERLEKQSFGVK
jgi:hypothetical protein